MSLALVALLLLALASSSSTRGGGGASELPAAPRQSLEDFRKIASRGGLTPKQADFLAFVAYGESGLNPRTGLGNPAQFPPGTQPNTRPSVALQMSEANAARIAYERNESWLGACPHPATAYSFGSGGLFGQLPTYAMAQFRGTSLECASPYLIFEPSFAIAAAYGFARGLTMRDDYQGTVESLRSGWGLPSAIGDPDRIMKKSPKWRRHLRALGMPEAMLAAKAPTFPRRDLVAMVDAMEGVSS
jgi:hypothetical protein